MEKMSISNLNKNAGASTGSGIAYQQIEPITELENPNITKSEKTIADLSQLPEEKESTNGVILKKSIEDDLLGKGSVFEDYLKEKEEERDKLYEAIDAHNEMIAAELGEEVPEEITDEDVARSAKMLSEMNEEQDPFVDDSAEVEVISDYVDPLEKELEEEEVKNTVKFNKPSSNLEEIEKQTSSNNAIAKAAMAEDVGQGVKFTIDEEDLLDDDEDEENDEESKANLKELQSTISEKIAGVSKQLNIKSFAISNTPISAKSVLRKNESSKKVADWGLFASKMHFGMSEFSGTDISTLGSNTGLNQYSSVYNRYKLFLDHMVGENKPSNVESFVKSVSFLDNDDLYGGVYVTNFSGSNYLPYDCPKCKYTFLSENIPIEDMYEFEKPEDEEEFKKIRSEQYYQLSDLYVSEVVPITENFAFSFREPSIYSIIFETALLDEKFSEKYRDIISVLSYIDNIYYIDTESGVISPIGYKRYPSNKTKDVKSRIIEYSKIINSLNPDEYNIILAYLAAINTQHTGMKWKLPECTCPKCGTVIKERETTAENLVFMRHQLAALAITSIK